MGFNWKKRNILCGMPYVDNYVLELPNDPYVYIKLYKCGNSLYGYLQVDELMWREIEKLKKTIEAQMKRVKILTKVSHMDYHRIKGALKLGIGATVTVVIVLLTIRIIIGLIVTSCYITAWVLFFLMLFGLFSAIAYLMEKF